MPAPEHPDPVVAACMGLWDVPAERVRFYWLEDDVLFSARAEVDGESVSTIGALTDGTVTFDRAAAESVLLAHWQGHRPAPTTAADALAALSGLESVHRVTERMPSELHPPRIGETGDIEFWASTDGEEQRYFNLTVHFPAHGPATVSRQAQ